MSEQLFAIIAPVLICAALGFLWIKLGMRYDTEFITTLITNIGTPALVFSTLVGRNIGRDVASLGDMALASIVAVAAMLAIGTLALRLLRLPYGTYLPALAFSNAGNMGLPLCLFAFGEAGLALAIVYFAVTSILNFTLGVALASGTMSPLRLLRTPIIWAVAISIAVILARATPPDWAMNTIDLVGQMTIPLMLLTLGVSLASLGLGKLMRSTLLSLLRLGMGFGVGVAVAWGLGLGFREGGVLVVQAAMPVAVFNYLFAQRYGKTPEDVAGMVLMSTVISFLTLPFLLAYVLERGG